MSVLREALPEFLGSLGAGLLFALGSWVRRKRHAARTVAAGGPGQRR